MGLRRPKKIFIFLSTVPHINSSLSVLYFPKRLKHRGIILHIPRSTKVSVTLSELAPPAPLTQASVSPPWNPGGGGGNTRLRGGGGQVDDWRESLALCLGLQ